MNTIKKQLIIMIGDYGAGKTTCAKWYTKKYGGLYIDFELLYFKNQQNDAERFDVFVRRLAETIGKNPQELYAMDGYQAVTGGYGKITDPTFTYLKDSIKCDVHLCLCFTAPHVFRQRQAIKAPHVSEPLPRDEEEIKRITYSLYSLAITTDTNPIFVDTTEGCNLVTKEDWPQRWEELIFLSELDKKSHDKYYQDIELPSGLVIPGYSRSHETWARLSQIIDFKDKTILDIGCCHGFICFKAEEAGAQEITGMELNDDAIAVVRQVAWLKKSKARFLQGNLATLKADRTYDIVLALNMLHHVKDIDQGLKNIFKTGHQVVFEIPVTQEEIVSQAALSFGFLLKARANSHREDREILIFAHPEANSPTPVVPSAYQYNYRQEYTKKLVGTTIARAAKIKVLYPLVWIVRRYRRLRKTYLRPLVRYREKAS
ncbi:class I SAM-dependent methyltransferase [Chloroflexota bacterium]